MRRIAVLSALVVSVTACGKKGPLIYPDMLVPAAPGAVIAEQSGASIRLVFDIPDKDRSGRRLNDISGVTILRRDTEVNLDPNCRSCISDYRQFRRLFLDAPGAAQRFGNRLVLFDGDIQEKRSYTYLVRVFAKDGTDGVPAASVPLAVVTPILPPVLSATPAPTEVRLEFTGKLPESVELLGYNLYRAVKGEPLPFLPVNSQLISAPRYTDSGMARGVTYRYVARTVVRGQGGAVVESLASNEVEAALLDDE